MEQENLWLLGYPEEYFERSVLAPAFFEDLNLDQVVELIMAERRKYDLKRYFNRMPKDVLVTRQRQKVLQAVGEPRLFDALIEFSEYMQCARKFAADYGEAKTQQRKFLLDCGVQYVLALKALWKAFFGSEGEAFPAGKTEALHTGESKKGETAVLEAAGKAASQNGEKSGQAGTGMGEILEAFAKKLRTYLSGEDFQTFYRDTETLSCEFEKMAFRIEFAGRRLRVASEEGEEKKDYFDKLRALFPENAEAGRVVHGQIESPFGAKKELGELEIFILAVCQKKYPASFEKLQNYEQKYSALQKRELTVQMREKGMEEEIRVPEFLKEWVLVFERQLQVYLAVELFTRKIKKTGYPLSYAVFTQESQESLKEEKNGNFTALQKQMELRSAYDMALLLKQMNKEKPVVCNDVYYEDRERFLVVTGPNQGGKTTFARSTGQIVYFAKMGFAAPCAFAQMPYFTGLLTHFSVEESLETGRGKLKEELTRLEPMMHEKHRKSFVILNELFTTAATYDAYIMGRRVMEHFIKQECFGIYVTHIQELASEEGNCAQRDVFPEENSGGQSNMYSEGRIVSMAACVDEQDSHIRTYRIVRRAAEGVGYAYGLVEKYHLTYPELKERLKRLADA